MPSFDIARGALVKSSSSTIAVGAFASGDGVDLADGAAAVAEALGVDLVEQLLALGFDAKAGEVVAMPAGSGVGAGTLLVFGLGPQDEVDGEALRRAGGKLAEAAAKSPSLGVQLPLLDTIDDELVVQALVEGIELGSYRYDEFKSESEPAVLEAVSLHHDGGDAKGLKRGLEVGEVTAAAACLARDLVNTPPQAKRPTAFAARAKDEFKGTKVKVKVIGESELEKLNCGGILGVSRGSEEPGQLVQLSYAPSGAKKHVVLVGKGITFDSGGLSLKPGDAMMTMKMDMGGAATVLAAIKAIAELGAKVKVTGLLALAENMPSGHAIRPSDVLTMHNGKTVEVLNTDAEGRLVMADALSIGSDMKPDVIVDMATLTGAALIALGDQIGVVIGNDEDTVRAIREAGDRAAEPFWELPLPTELYGDRMKSDVADIRNIGNPSRQAGTITAALFLEHFVADGLKWAHLDIAGIAWTDGKKTPYQSKGATGSPVRTVVEWLRTL